MNVQIFPNWVKKITIPVFLISFVTSQADDFIKGWRDGHNNQSYNYDPDRSTRLVEIYMGGGRVMHILEVISLLMVLFYVLSKEKIEDEYIKKLRFESYQVSFILIVIIAITFYTFDIDFRYGLGDSVGIFMFLYLIIFFFKKRIY